MRTRVIVTRGAVACCGGVASRTPFLSAATRARRAAKRGRPLTFDKDTYVQRNVVERCNNRPKQWRGLATRYEKRAVNYRAMVVLASIVLWLEP